MEVSCQPPLEKAGVIDRWEKKLQHFTTERPITAVITGVALTALAIFSLTVSAPTTWGTIGVIVAGAIITELAIRVVSTGTEQWSHRFFDRFIVAIFDRRDKQPPPHPLPCVYSEREIFSEDGETLLARLHYQKNTQEVDQPIVELHSTDPEKRGFCEGLLLAPHIDTIYRRVIKPQITAAAKEYGDKDLSQLKGRIQQLTIPTEYRAELKGLAAGIREYTEQTGHKLPHLTEEALLIANLFAEVYPTRSNRTTGATVSNAGTRPAVVGHNIELASQGLLGKYLYIRRIITANGHSNEGIRVEMLSYPGNVGLMAGKNHEGRVVTYTQDDSPLTGQETPKRLQARQRLETTAPYPSRAEKAPSGIQVFDLGAEQKNGSDSDAIATVKSEVKAANKKHTLATVLYEGVHAPEYHWDNYYAARRVATEDTDSSAAD